MKQSPSLEFHCSNVFWVSLDLVNTFQGYRWSAATAYLRPSIVKNMPNLHVISDAEATRVIIDPATKTATAVEFVIRDGDRVTSGVRRTVGARKEVIISAGAINSPKLLLLSGIGPKEELEKHGVRNIEVHAATRNGPKL